MAAEGDTCAWPGEDAWRCGPSCLAPASSQGPGDQWAGPQGGCSVTPEHLAPLSVTVSWLCCGKGLGPSGRVEVGEREQPLVHTGENSPRVLLEPFGLTHGNGVGWGGEGVVQDRSPVDSNVFALPIPPGNPDSFLTPLKRERKTTHPGLKRNGAGRAASSQNQ